MLGHKKEIFLRRRTINGQDNRSLPLPSRLSLFIKILNSLSLSRAFDTLFSYKTKPDAIVLTRQGKVDKNLFDYLLKRNETSFSDLRSRSPMRGNKSIYSRASRSRTPIKKLRVKRKPQNGSLANFGNGAGRMGGRNKDLYMSQNLAQNPNFFKLASDQEIPLSSQNIMNYGHKSILFINLTFRKIYFSRNF